MSGLRHRHIGGLHPGLSERELVERCQNNERESWNEFFRRFVPDIKASIIQVLRASGHLQFLQDGDIVWQIHERIVIDLVKEEKLKLCKDPSGIRAWLKTLASNQTVDWLRQYGANKRLPERVTDRTMISLETPIGQDSDLTLGDVISGEPPCDREIRQYLEGAISTIDSTSRERALWVLRLSILLHLPLSEKDLVELSSFNGFSMGELRSRVTKITEKLAVLEKRRSTAEQVAVLYWYQIRHLEALYSEKSKEPSDQNKEVLEDLERKIRKMTQLRDKHLRKTQRLCRPSNRDIAELVGIAEKNAVHISTILIRARSMLKKKMSKHNELSPGIASDSSLLFV